MRVVIVSGHSEQKVGAQNKELRLYENDLVKKICAEVFLRERDIEVDVVLKKRNATLTDLPMEIASLDPDLVIEVHLNAANKAAQGCETVVMNYAKKSRKFADIMQKVMVANMGIRDRGVKPITQSEAGGYLLHNLCQEDIPCIITETFFMDAVKSHGEMDDLIEKSVETILAFIDEL